MPFNPAPHIIARFVEMGMSEAAGMGVAPLSWREINAWQNAMHVALPPWEARLMKQLSTEYLAESRRAESENCASPWSAGVPLRERDIELARIRSVLG